MGLLNILAIALDWCIFFDPLQAHYKLWSKFSQLICFQVIKVMITTYITIFRLVYEILNKITSGIWKLNMKFKITERI